MKQKSTSKTKTLSHEEQKLLNIYLNEYDDIFQNILLQPPREFIRNIIKRVEISLKKKFNDIPISTRNKVEDFLTEQIYSKDYKIASMAFKTIEKRLNDNNKLPNIFIGKIFEHCCKDKKNSFYIHSCGEKFYTFKYKSLYNRENLFEENKNEEYNLFLICIKCELIYKSDLVKFYCNFSKIDFYSKIIDSSINKKTLPFATWKKYHCNAVINDTMKCSICKESLCFDKENNKLICLKCHLSQNPKNLKWNCLICHKDFVSEVKEYNQLEFKNMKICVKDTLINKIKARPEKLLCGCNYDIKSMKFFHKLSCKGDIYLGEMNRQQIIVCNKCDTISLYYNFNWTCPQCNKIFKNNFNNFIQTEPNKDELKYKSGNKIQNDFSNNKINLSKERAETTNNSFSKLKKSAISSKRMILREIPTPNKNIYNNNNNNHLCSKIQKMQSSRSPLGLIKQNLSKQFSGCEFEYEIKNLGYLFDKCNKSELFEKYIDNNNNNNNNTSNKNIFVNLSKDKIHLNKNSISTNGTDNSMISGSYDDKNINSKLETIIEYNEKEIKKEKLKEIEKELEKKREIERQKQKEIELLEKQREIEKLREKEKQKELEKEKEIQYEEKFDTDEYIIKNQIGEGSFGKIFLVESKKTHKNFALKKIVASSKKDIQNLKHEYTILSELLKIEKKINLVNIYGMETKQLDSTTFVLYVLMDLASSDWEREILIRQKKNMYYNENELLIIIKNLIKTFSQLQKINISHRDIKPQNILYFNKTNEYKLADFGEAKELIKNNNNNNTIKQTLRGTELYMSPILFYALRSKKYFKYINHNTFKSDVFSFGLCCLFASSLCYESLYDIRELNSNFSIRIVIEKYLNKLYSGKFIDLLCLMLELDEKCRCDFLELENIFEKMFF